MKAKKKRRTVGFRFVTTVVLSVVVTLFLANHIASILFGQNSVEVYTGLKHQKAHLTNEIKYYQKENARLQKEYFELKNLEPVQ